MHCPAIHAHTKSTSRGLDNAGKTTIVKKIMGEDVNTVSPTLGFIIKTIDYDGYVFSIPGPVSSRKGLLGNMLTTGVDINSTFVRDEKKMSQTRDTRLTSSL